MLTLGFRVDTKIMQPETSEVRVDTKIVQTGMIGFRVKTKIEQKHAKML